MGKFRKFLTELSARDRSILLFQEDNFSNYQWIFMKLGMCTDIMDLLWHYLSANFINLCSAGPVAC